MDILSLSLSFCLCLSFYFFFCLSVSFSASLPVSFSLYLYIFLSLSLSLSLFFLSFFKSGKWAPPSSNPVHSWWHLTSQIYFIFNKLSCLAIMMRGHQNLGKGNTVLEVITLGQKKNNKDLMILVRQFYDLIKYLIANY